MVCPVFAAAGAANKIPVLMYHHILKDDENVHFKENSCVLSYEKFKEQMKYLYDNGFTTITAKQLVDFLYNKKELPSKSIMLSFDDGYYSNIVHAYPILKEYGFKAVIFAITGMIEDEIQPFDPNMLDRINRVEMKKTVDVFDYASHSHNLHYMNEKLSAIEAVSDDEFISDTKKSLSLTEINNKICYSYPYGKYGKNTIQHLKQLGFRLAFIAKKGYVKKSTDPFKINRFDIYQDMTFSRFQKIVELTYM